MLPGLAAGFANRFGGRIIGMLVAYTLVLAVWLVHFVVMVSLVIARIVVARLWTVLGALVRLLSPKRGVSVVL